MLEILDVLFLGMSSDAPAFKVGVFARPVARGCDAPPNLPKVPLLATKWAKKIRCL